MLLKRADFCHGNIPTTVTAPHGALPMSSSITSAPFHSITSLWLSHVYNFIQMEATTLSKWFQTRLNRAIKAIYDGKSYREASASTRIPIATLHRACRSRGQTITKPGRGTSLTQSEERLLVSLLQRYADRGIPLNRLHLIETVKALISRMDPGRADKLLFKNGTPGRKFLQSFQKRHKDELIFARPTRQEAIRYAACNRDTLTTHFAALEKVINDKT